MRVVIFSVILCLLTVLPGAVLSDELHRHDGYGPLSVMGEHVHQQGEWMFSYRYAHMEMAGNRINKRRVSAAEVLEDFMVTPLEMTMRMHMLGGMWGASDELSVMFMVPYLEKSMDLRTRSGKEFKTTSRGLGDIRITGIYKLLEGCAWQSETCSKHTLLVNFGLALPTGSRDEEGQTPAGRTVLPYPMQLGSGTYDPIFELTYKQEYPLWLWCAQVGGTFRIGRNDEGYRLGHATHAKFWLARNLFELLSISVQLDGKKIGNIHGRDKRLDAGLMRAPVPTARPDLRGGERVDLLFGMNLLAGEGVLAGNRLAVEYGFPVYQNLDGPQLEVDHHFVLGWQHVF